MDPLPASYYGQLDKSNPLGLHSGVLTCKYILVLLFMTVINGVFARSVKLFDIWKKYKPRLPSPYYEEQLMQLADFLFQRKVSRLLQPVLSSFTNYSGMQKLLSILAFLRIMMQAILPHESLCWLLYNGTLCIYEISRFLMSVSHSAQALDFLLWACVCLETSIPLLTPGLLPWRATLYCAVCACYYDEQAAVQAEVFARRALGKIRELEKLVEMSDSLPSAETQQAFKEATIKLAVMVFKRSVYEPRRKSKGIFKYKQKGNVREGHNVSGVWPRSLTERILMELFVGNAAQFLAVLEALRDTSRRPLPTGMSKEAEIQDVELELIMAGISILSGFHRGSCFFYCPGENRISVDAAVTFVKLLFRYEQWDMFCTLSDSLVTFVGLVPMTDELLDLVQTLHACVCDTAQVSFLSNTFLIFKLHTKRYLTVCLCVCVCVQDMQPDGDLVLDIVLFVWEKCKLMFQRAQARPNDSVRYMGKMEYKDKHKDRYTVAPWFAFLHSIPYGPWLTTTIASYPCLCTV
uniref:Cilia and flagella associated protein 54 n=1 Tax=Electrophorus electricus TaxID=8005 RepID=A0A4W4DMW2_ELEEL